MAPLGYPQMPQMGFPMGYGYAMPGYPQPMPGYGFAMPGGYPMGMPAMPAMPQYPMPQQQPNPAGGQAGAGRVSELPVRLPDPSQTGAAAPAPAAPAAPGQAPAPTDNPSNSAADIIKQFMQRRPTH
jgi:hypothetical protein